MSQVVKFAHGYLGGWISGIGVARLGLAGYHAINKNMGSLRQMDRSVRQGRVCALGAVLLLLFPTPSLWATDLIEILPVTNDVLLLHFKDGHIDYNGVRPDGTYEPQTENRVSLGKLLDIQAATDASRYRITSDDDPDYADGRGPTAMGHKAKGAEFNSPYKQPQYLREYWVYAALPSPLQPDKTYTVRVGDLAENLNQYRFTFNAKRLRSPTIHVSQVGFPPDAPKYAYLSQWMGTLATPRHAEGGLDLSGYTEGTFHICDARSGEVRKTYRGLRLQKSRKDNDPSFGNWTRADVYSLDFSDFREPGRYVVVAERMGCSYPFEISESAYFEPHRAVMRGVFLQRRGIAKDLYEFSREYPRSHHPDINEFVAGKVEGEGGKIRDPKPVEGIWGWYADAGDWDGYASHYVVPMTLMLAYDLRPGHFGDGDIGNRWKHRPDDAWIDEGSNGVPDILDEARWWVDFCRRARSELKRQGLGTGGVPRYVGRDAGATESPSWADRRVQYVDTGEAEPTYAYAAAAAYLAHCLNEHQARLGRGGAHPEAAGWIDEARDAFAWGEAQGKLSENEKRLRQLAAVCLYLTTGEASFQEVFRSEWRADEQAQPWHVGVPECQRARLGHLCCVQQGPARPECGLPSRGHGQCDRPGRLFNESHRGDRLPFRRCRAGPGRGDEPYHRAADHFSGRGPRGDGRPQVSGRDAHGARVCVGRQPGEPVVPLRHRL